MTRLTRHLSSLNSIAFSSSSAAALCLRSPVTGTLTSPFQKPHNRRLLRFPPPLVPKSATFATSHRPMDPETSAAADAALAEDFVHVGDSDSAAIPDRNPSPNPDGSSEGTSGSVDRIEEDFASGEGGGGEVSPGGEVAVLPEELMKRVTVLSCESTAEGGSCDVYLVGTAHVSQESCREVQAVISSLKPQVVFLELCSNRVAILAPQNLKVPTMTEMVDMWKKNHNLFGILYSWFLAKVASKLEVFPGSEFRVAFEEALKYGGRVILGDRPVNITLKRTWGSMPLWHKVKLLYSLFFQAVFLPSPEDLNKMLKEMDDVDALTLLIQEMSKQFPTVMETLVHERDQYMSSTLLRVASEQNLVVAVVGKGHVQGIKKHWKQPIEIKDLLEMPSLKPSISAGNVIKSIGIAVAGVAIVSGIYLASKK